MAARTVTWADSTSLERRSGTDQEGNAEVATPEAEDFAALLKELKDRSGRSYGVLAGRLHVSTSTLHRYCNGDAVPNEYAPVERLARLCAATPEELVELHRRWIVADAARRRPAAAAPEAVPVPAPAPAEPVRDAVSDMVSESGPEAGRGSEAGAGGDASDITPESEPEPEPEPTILAGGPSRPGGSWPPHGRVCCSRPSPSSR